MEQYSIPRWMSGQMMGGCGSRVHGHMLLLRNGIFTTLHVILYIYRRHSLHVSEHLPKRNKKIGDLEQKLTGKIDFELPKVFELSEACNEEWFAAVFSHQCVLHI